jgi:hypothetical protein
MVDLSMANCECHNQMVGIVNDAMPCHNHAISMPQRGIPWLIVLKGALVATWSFRESFHGNLESYGSEPDFPCSAF